MAIDGVRTIPMLCQRLISFAFQRCRISGDLCRISVALSCSQLDGRPLIRVSNTGAASSLEEFRHLQVVDDWILSGNWDGILSVRTTGFSDEEVQNYSLNLRQGTSTPWMTRLPSIAKNGARFRGSQLCISVSEKIDVLLVEIKHFFEKMLILNFPNIAFELAVQHENAYKSCLEDSFLPKKCTPSPFSASKIECLKHGFEDYILKHWNGLYKNHGLCWNAMEHLKTGVGTVHSSEISSRQSPGFTIDVVITISEFPSQTSPCLREGGFQTEVLYFKDSLPSLISKSSLNALRSIDWKSYGLKLGSIMDQGGGASLNWENLPLNAHIDIVIHCYQAEVNFPSSKQTVSSERALIKKATKLALDDMKERHSGILLSDHALKIRSHAPDLARTLTGLVLSSTDMEFQGECLSLLGLQSKVRGEIVEECIKDKIISVIELNDRKPERCKEVAPFLFEDNCFQEINFEDEYEGEDTCDSLDLLSQEYFSF